MGCLFWAQKTEKKKSIHVPWDAIEKQATQQGVSRKSHCRKAEPQGSPKYGLGF